LEELADHFTSADRNVKKDQDGYYYLRSSEFRDLTDSEAVRERGAELLRYMNGAMKLLFGPSYRAVEFDTVARIEEDGQRYHTVGASITIGGRSRVTIKPTVIRADGTVDDVLQAPTKLDTLVTLANRNEKVADALRFYASGNWVNLYKAWEVVCDAAGGSHAVVKNGWAAELNRNRFTGTAQSRAQLGDEARHASEKYKAPKNPMTLEEAREFVRSVIQAWVATI
jgi:hypothetical protein